MHNSAPETTRDENTDILFSLLKRRHAPYHVKDGGGGLLCLPFDPRIKLRKEGALENANELTI